MENAISPETVKAKTFSCSRRGYNKKQADSFLDYISKNLSSVPVTTILSKTFSAEKKGYDTREVDAFLDELAVLHQNAKSLRHNEQRDSRNMHN